MEQLGLNVSKSLELLCRGNGECGSELQGFLAKQIWAPGDRQSLLCTLSRLLLRSNCTRDVIRSFRVIALELVCLTKKQVKEAKNALDRHGLHQAFCVALGKVITISPEIKGFALSYLSSTEAPYQTADESSDGPPSKKSKKIKTSPPTKLELVRATWDILSHLPEMKAKWDWSEFLPFLKDEEPKIKWYAVLTVARVVHMSPSSLESFKKIHFSTEQISILSIECEGSIQESQEKALMLVNPSQPENDSREGIITHTMKEIVDGDLSEDVACVCGVVLPRLSSNVSEESDSLILVPSTQRNLRCLALGIAAGSALLLEGPVGSGKTALVEHLGHLTGRNGTPQLMKIQLGDQTDSKALLGTYRCTDVPGEFVWQPGALTTAVREGHWVLLEDLDYAPMDVVSLLLPLLESRTLSIPGHGDQVTAHPQFRIFATLRLMSSGSGWHRQHNAGMDVMEKLWIRVPVEPLSRDELKQVMTSQHPQLSSVADKLLDIYFLLSSGKHELSGDGSQGESCHGDEENKDTGKFLNQGGRLISTRDLMKWCGRIAMDFDASKVSTATLVYEEALDCFCASLHKPERLLALAESIAARINITKNKAEYYCHTHKPNVEVTVSRFTVGRACLQKKLAEAITVNRMGGSNFAFTRQAVCLLERVAVAVARNEPVLLVGETGTGKTSSVQYLSQQMGHTLRVVNMNQQSDSTDLLGGFKPVDIRIVVAPFREEFELTFSKTFSRKQNATFLGHVQECFAKRRWRDMFKLLTHTTKAALGKTEDDEELHGEWQMLHRRLKQLKSQVKQTESALAFSFIEGTLVRALKRGEWVLLDEINLATAETLECLSGLLESSTGSVVLLERGDTDPIVRHPDFRLFACMNPATDVGKKDLPPGVRNRFTELYMAELEDPQDLKILVAEYLKGLSLSAKQIDGIVKFYLTIRNEAAKKLIDGTGHKPCYSLRTLCRALQHCAANPCGNVPRSLYEGFCLSFLTQLDRSSHPVVQQLVCQLILGKQTAKSLLKQALPEPSGKPHLNFEGYWVAVGTKEPNTPEGYVLTPSVRGNLRDLARVVSAGRHPVLLQGETSVGKTSLITWLAEASGNVCMRINNHEHTDIQEYVGCYSADDTGKLVFKEGLLVEAMKKGFWIILDELNLAPSDVLEALNRLLDDNRELFIAETQEVVKAHPRFMLFATQNPPGQYGGRKILSRAFRNRFVELHFSELPSSEVETILHQRCRIPMSYSRKLVAVMVDLQTRRRSSGVFAGKQGYITLRDLFRWAERYRQASDVTTEKYFDWDQLLADNGYMLLAGRVRRPEECLIIQEVLQKHLKRHVDPHNLFTLHDSTSPTTRSLLNTVLAETPGGYDHVVWTYSMRRMAVLVGQALKFGEPVLLVGETGCGKTTICQMFAAQMDQMLHSVNCHLHTESADFLGGLRPVRQHSEDLKEKQKLFEWCDGPLVKAMRDGTIFLVDEISLADDSVLERLNSVLEPERTLLLAEKGGGDGSKNEIDVIVAKETFRIVSTMNPGGDFGKKELSPALRNRFTEIWCPLNRDHDDMVSIMTHNLHQDLKLGRAKVDDIAEAIMRFVEWFSNNDYGKRCTLSIRDILTWVNFINIMATPSHVTMETDDPQLHTFEPAMAYIHGACMVFLDSLGSGVTSSSDPQGPTLARQACLSYLLGQLKHLTGHIYSLSTVGLDPGGCPGLGCAPQAEGSFCIQPFSIKRGSAMHLQCTSYALNAPTTSLNAQRVLRGLQLSRPILLEGSPGVGKTSLVAAIAASAGHELVRINLSEQTDISDLFGADLPVEGAEGGRFEWRDGPLLRALKAGHWVVLDELNLASQSVLEGLNACLDHRAEVYIPELGRSFRVQHDKTRLFACQNPLHQGGGRKGLPRSFLNRFTQVYVEPLSREDLLFITGAIYPELPQEVLALMVDFNQQLFQETMVESEWGQRGGPWEFNLRDIFRWCDLVKTFQNPDNLDPGEYVTLVYQDRMRTASDKSRMQSLYTKIFSGAAYNSSRQVAITTEMIQVGHSFLGRKNTVVPRAANCHLGMLHHGLHALESLMKCIEMKWMAILVGPSASGKTSVVQLLAQLCGTQLDILPMNSAMDTTELLGGFEQMDLKRHLESLVNDIEGVLHHCLARIFATRDQPSSNIEKLLHKWHKYQTHHTGEKDKNLTNTDEIDILQKDLETLEEIINQIIKLAKKFNLTESDSAKQLRRPLHQLAELLEKNKTARHGGTFEWIDSVLVRALTKGHWLLIDNVNFCSPSVLDRLNALLEPNGVLSINERGVIDGQIPTIKPHKDFRLILALDPRHGEISRAMRNRGVEIYMLGEDEGASYDDHDIKSMFRGFGMVGKVPTDVLLSLHSSVKEKMSGITHFGVADLLRVALLVTQQLERGLDLSTALYNGSMEVYVRPNRDFLCKQAIFSLISDLLHDVDLSDHEEKSQASSLLDLGQWPDGLPMVTSWCEDVVLATIQQNSALVLHCLNQFMVENDKRSRLPLTYTQMKGLGHVLPSGEDKTTNLSFRKVEPSAKIVLEQCGIETWQKSVNWLDGCISSRVSKSKKDRLSEKANEEFVRSLPDVITKTIQTVFEHPLMNDLKSTMRSLCNKEDFKAWQEMTFDLRWNEAFLKRIQMSPEGQMTDGSRYLHMHEVCNQLYIVALLAKNAHLHTEGLDTLQKPPRRREASLLQLSYAAKIGLVEPDQLPDSCIIHLYPLIKQLDQDLQQIFQDFCNIDNDKLQKVVRTLQRYEWFVRFCRQPCRETPQEVLLPTLSLHWCWLWEELLQELQLSDRLSATSLPITSILQSALGTDSLAAHIHSSISQTFGQPRPYPSPLTARLLLRVQSYCSITDIGKVTPALRSKVKVKLALLQKEGVILKTRLMTVLHRLWTENADEIQEWVNQELQEVENVLERYNLIGAMDRNVASYRDNVEKDDMDMDTSLSAGDIARSLMTPTLEVTDVELLPVHDYMSVAMEMNLVSALLGTKNDYNMKDVQKWMDFVLEKGSFSPAAVQIWNAMKENKLALDTSPGIHTEILTHLLRNVWSTAATDNPQNWLLWQSMETVSFGHDIAPMKEFKGPAIMNKALLSNIAFHLLSEQAVTSSEQNGKRKRMQTGPEDSILPNNIPLGLAAEKLQQISRLKQCLLASVASASAVGSYSTHSLDLISSSLVKLLRAIEPVVAPAHQVAVGDLEKCQGNLRDLINVFLSLDSEKLTHLIPNIRDLFSLLHEAVAKLQKDGGTTQKGNLPNDFSIGETWAYCGMLQSFLLAPQGPVDPAHELSLRLDYAQQEIADVETELEVRKQHQKMLTGMENSPEGSTHPLVENLKTNCDEKRDWVEKHAGLIATRPHPPQFHILLAELRQFQSSFASTERILSMISDLRRAFGTNLAVGKEQTPHIVRECKAWLTTTAEFVKKMENQYPFYRDLLLPCLVGIRQIEFGIHMMGHSVEAFIENTRLHVDSGLVQKTSIQDVVEMLSMFPFVTEKFPSSLAISEEVLKDTTRASISHIASETVEQSASNTMVQRRILKYALQHMRNHLATTLTLDSAVTYILSTIFHVYVVAWSRAEEERKDREAEKESLYRYKSTVHGDPLNEEQRDQKEIEQQFPTFEQEFEDITVGPTLEGKTKSSAQLVTDTDDYGIDDDLEALNLSADEMSNVSELHQMAFKNLTNTSWHQGSPAVVEPELNYVEPVVTGYQVAAPLGRSLYWILDSSLDSHLLGSHLLVSKILQDSSSVESTTKISKKPYDVYRDPNVPEAVRCRPVVERFRSRVMSLLEEWSDHPTLKQIIEVIHRILNFPVTSPLMKFVTGLEILLQKAQEWESNAARFVSLSEHMEATTALIIDYRKHELSCWNSCMDTVHWKVRQNASRWWFHLYQLLESFLGTSEQTDLTGAAGDDLGELTEAIKQFLEGATLGEYATRLGMVEAFHYQVVNMDTSSKQLEIRNLLWNLHQHYHQFVNNVQNEIDKLRSPLEKQLKGFVKIARWNDINYYAVKHAIVQTHKTLHKHMKEFGEILSRPVQPLLTEDVKPDWSSKSMTEASGSSPEALNIELFVKSQDGAPAGELIPSAEASELQQRLHSLSARFTKHCHRVMAASKHSSFSLVLDEFTGELIESVHEFQTLAVTQSEDKDKQKSEAKYIHQRKRKALADLFKYLRGLGLSHKKGLTAVNAGTINTKQWMLASPLDVSTALLQLQPDRCDNETSTRWQGCSKYYWRCLSRRVLLHTALGTPSQELGLPNLERCKGFSEHLTHLVLTQRAQLTELTTRFIKLRDHSSSHSLVRDHEPQPHADTSDWLNKVKCICDQSLEGLQQVVLVLECVSGQSVDGSTSIVSPFPTWQECQVLTTEGSTEARSHAITKLNSVVDRVREIKRRIALSLKETTIATSLKTNLLMDCKTELEQMIETLTDIESGFILPVSNKIHPLAETLVFIKSQIHKTTVNLSRWLSDCQGWNSESEFCSEKVQDFSSRIDSFITDLLLVVQKFVSKQKEALKRTETAENEDKSEDDIQDDHLTKHMQDDLQTRVHDLNVQKITDHISTLLEMIKQWSNVRSDYPAAIAASRLLGRCVPLVEQYCTFVQCVLTEYISAHRASAKLLSVLLALFTELAQKGFCLPADMSDDVEGEGATDFKDIEGGGIGEGSGAKDVSDQIETEDQLEEAHRQGEEQKPEDHSQQPDIQSEDNAIEMNNDFDGKSHDLEAEGEEGSESEEEAENEHDLDRQMGDLENAEADKLDEQIWGSDEEEEEQNEQNKEEFGPGAGEKSESELVAKDDNQDKTDTQTDKQEQKDQGEKEDQIREQEMMDEAEYNENEVDPHYNDQSEKPEAEAMDLPEDLNLDDAEEGGDEEEESKDEQNAENQHDIDKLKDEAEEVDDNNKDDKTDDLAEDKENEDKTEEGPEESRDVEKNNEEEPMETDQEPSTDELNNANQDRGFEPKDDNTEETQEEEQKPEGTAKEAMYSGKTEHDSSNVQQSEEAQNAAGEDDKENEGSGLAETEENQGHQGENSTSVTRGSTQQQKTQKSDRNPGKSSEDRSTGRVDEKIQKRLQTIDSSLSQNDAEEPNNQPDKSDLYEHIKKSESHYDTQTLDVATDDQQQPVPNVDEEEAEDMGQEEEMEADDNTTEVKEESRSEEMKSAKLKKPSSKPGEDTEMEQDPQGETEHMTEVEGERVQTSSVPRGQESTFHTHMKLFLDHSHEADLEKLRLELEQGLTTWTGLKPSDPHEELLAQEAWSRYETLTSSLSQELCEQLRLVLEPTQAAKLRGDFRTGKRLNMRKVIPYIASQFRKDKIWLRRTKPSKRQYQVMVAVDDSSSMADNHSKQLAFESLSTIANALSLLEVGELAISSFGESVKLLHPFHEQFTSQSGARILQQFTFEQKKTKIAQLLGQVTAIMMDGKSRQRASQAPAETSQLLLVVSDGRGLFLEGVEVVKAAVRRAREANVFLVFVVVDNPDNKDSILDIRVPVFKGAGQLPEIKSYMDDFPFPFYIILRDINSLPHTLSDALRQWFELVTASDR